MFLCCSDDVCFCAIVIDGVCFMIGKLKLERGDRSSAEQLLRSALQANPGNAEARAVLASLSNHR